MTKTFDVFCEIPCLTERSKQLNGIALQKKWFKTADKRIIGQYLQKFITYNLSNFNFLGVRPFITGADQSTSLSFHSSKYIGAIPLRASDTGKQIGDFVVTPRFIGKSRFEDYIEILNLLETEINPEVKNSLPLASGKNFRPPLYLEAINFITSLEKLVSKSWNKFDSLDKKTNQPTGQINWTKYVHDEFKVENRLQFQTKKNVLNEFHLQYSEIRFVFDICKKEILSGNTPQRIKNTNRGRLSYLEKRLYRHKPKVTHSIIISNSDSPTIKSCKSQANKILNFNLIDSTAWRVDFADVFEKFIQHIFKEVAKSTGGKVYSNIKFRAKSSKRYSWELKHVEPDAIYQKANTLVFVDAKYKSNLYNKFDQSDTLKESHRHDLHQIMAYSSFSNTNYKYGFLVYPSDKLEVKNISYKNNVNSVLNNVFILGVPLKKSSIEQSKQLLKSELYQIEKKIMVQLE